MKEPAKIILYDKIGRAAGPNTVAKYIQRLIDGVNSAIPFFIEIRKVLKKNLYITHGA